MSQQLFDEFQQLENSEKFTLIFKEMMLSFYPQVEKFNARIALDLGFLYIYKRLEDDCDKTSLINFWSKKSLPVIIQLPMGEFYYRPYIDFINLDRVMNGLFIETIFEQLIKFQTLSFTESCAIIFDLERYFTVPLSEMDVKIIETIRDCLYSKKKYTNETLSTFLNVRSNYISRRIGYLRNNAYFRVTGTVNYPKIGLKLFIILLSSSPEFTSQIPEYFASPYTRTIRRCPNQRYDYIISITLPDKYEITILEHLKHLKNLLVIRDYFIDEVVSLSNNLNFTYYSYLKRPSVLSANKPGFFIDWFKERINCMTDSSYKNDHNTFHQFFFKGNKIDFSSLDLRVITLYRRDLDCSVRTLANRLSLSWEETNTHLEKAKKLLFPMILLYYMGLNETAILFFDNISKKNLLLIENLLVRMPQIFSYSFKKGGVIMTIDLMNGAHRLNDLICETLPEIKNAQFFLASKTSGIFRPIPHKLFCDEKKDWVFPENSFYLMK